MTFSDYLIDSILVLIVLRQLRESRLDLRAILLPLGIVGYVAHTYLGALPTSGNDIPLVIGMVAGGIALGTAGALTTRVRSDGGRHALVKASWISASLWVTSMGARFAFAVWATHGGGPALARFSAAHGLNVSVWTDAILLLALAEVISRVGVLSLRAHRAQQAHQSFPAQPELISI